MGGEDVERALETLEQVAPETGLPVVRTLRARLEQLEAVHVNRAVEAGWTWREVAEALGVSKQAAHKKHAARVASSRETARPSFVVTGRARRAVRLAREEARAAGHREVAPEHLVLGLLQGDAGPAAEALGRAGATLEAGRRALGRGGNPIAPGESIPISADLREVFEGSMHAAVRRGDPYLGVEHLLRVLVRERDAPGVAFLRQIGVDRGRLARFLDEARGGWS